MRIASRSAFSPRIVLSLVVLGFMTFLATLYFISVGDTGRGDNDGGAHAAAKGLNGYAGLARLLEAEGYDVTLSRSPSAFETNDLLVLTPPMSADPEEIGKILEDRTYVGPTLVILPKWWATGFEGQIRERLEGKVKDGWVRFFGSGAPDWTSELPEPFAFEVELEELKENESTEWTGMGLASKLPARTVLFAKDSPLHDPLAYDNAGHALALHVLGEAGSEYFDEAHWTVFVTEPDLMNNYGLADADRAALALELIRFTHYEEGSSVTFDLTLNGLGSAQNLLTLAFRPPFLAATLCLILALLVVGWRAFRRFGPPQAEAPATAFGKSSLVANSAGLILRAKRLRLLTAPYAELSARRLARRLGLNRATSAEIDAAIARALPDEEPYSNRAARLRHAEKPAEILSAAEDLHELERKLS